MASLKAEGIDTLVPVLVWVARVASLPHRHRCTATAAPCWSRASWLAPPRTF